VRLDMAPWELRIVLDRLYEEFNRREFVHPDPIEFLYGYDDPADREIVGLVASSLAYGRVAQILKTVSSILAAMGDHPSRFVRDASHDRLTAAFCGFRHRFTTEEELVHTLLGVQDAIREHGSLEKTFMSGAVAGDRTVTRALCRFAEAINCRFRDGCNSLIPHHDKKSSMKRLNLFLRWMVRRDRVDPGGWDGISPGALVVPLDTHLFRIARGLGFTERRSAGLATALEITERFRGLSPDDPVKYDFALTRFGIRAELRNRDLSYLLPSAGSAGS